LFVLPPWLEAWQRTLGRGGRALLLVAWEGGLPLGVAPLRVQGAQATFLGSADVCDYQDFVAAPAREADFLDRLLGHLAGVGVRRLDLGALRPDSVARRALPAAAEARGWAVRWEPAGVSVELDLPETWEAFLEGLGKRERHEVRRKLRRLDDAGGARLRRVDPAGELGSEVAAFLGLLAGYRQDKAEFLTPTYRSFFETLMERTGRTGLLDLSFLEVAGEVAAATLCFVHRGVTYLYNNGYHPRFAPLSVGLISKLWSIRAAMERGDRRYDLLKGDEPYKLRLGGRTVPLWRCRMHAV
jgi:CelD/BcsL family acetyltransferase involved in cellulose biosynthesis